MLCFFFGMLSAAGELRNLKPIDFVSPFDGFFWQLKMREKKRLEMKSSKCRKKSRNNKIEFFSKQFLQVCISLITDRFTHTLNSDLETIFFFPENNFLITNFCSCMATTFMSFFFFGTGNCLEFELHETSSDYL